MFGRVLLCSRQTLVDKSEPQDKSKMYCMDSGDYTDYTQVCVVWVRRSSHASCPSAPPPVHPSQPPSLSPHPFLPTLTGMCVCGVGLALGHCALPRCPRRTRTGGACGRTSPRRRPTSTACATTSTAPSSWATGTNPHPSPASPFLTTSKEGCCRHGLHATTKSPGLPFDLLDKPPC